MRNNFAETFSALAEAHNLVLITGDLGFGVFDNLERSLPKHFFNAGITEQSMTSLSAGLSDTGWLPFIYSIANFPTFRNLEQIRNDIAYPNRHVVIVSVGAGLSYGTLGSSHFGLEDFAVMRSLPNMRILSPSDGQRAKLATSAAVEKKQPTYLRLGKSGELPFGGLEQNEHIQMRQISRGSRELAVVSTGSIGYAVNQAINDLDFPVTHFSMEEIWPIENECIEVLSKFKRIIVVEEHVSNGGLFGILSEEFQRYKVFVELFPIGVRRELLTRSGDHEFMLGQANLTVSNIRDVISASTSD
jgi:transketolase